MSDKQTWIVVTKCRSLEGCSIRFDGGDFYFVDAYVTIPSNVGGIEALIIVLEKIQKELKNDYLELTEVKMCAQFLPEEWFDQTDNGGSVHEFASQSQETESVVFSSFRTEEIQELYVYHHNVRELEAE